MFGFQRRSSRTALIERLHAALVEASREPSLYGPGVLPDTVEGRFESLVIHALLTFRRLRALPDPAAEIAQDLVDAVFAHLEIAMRESGVGDMGVPKRMKKLGGAFYDRLRGYETALDAGAEAIAAELARRLDLGPADMRRVAGHVSRVETSLGRSGLDDILSGAAFRVPAPELAP